MFKGKFVVLAIAAAALLSWQMMPASVDSANSGIVDPCSSYATSAGTCWYLCPQGDGAALQDMPTNASISVYVRDGAGAPIAGIPAADFWVIGCAGGLVLNGGSGHINATAASDAGGFAAMTGAGAAGGQDLGLNVVVQGTVILDPIDWITPLCLGIQSVSFDLSGDLDVGGPDLSAFAGDFISGPYNFRSDMNCSNAYELVDFTLFAQHFGHHN
jgi:hypothetical protein